MTVAAWRVLLAGLIERSFSLFECFSRFRHDLQQQASKVIADVVAAPS